MDEEPQAGLEKLSAFDLPLPVFVAEEGTAQGERPADAMGPSP